MSRIDVVLMFGGLEDDETPMGQVHLLPIDYTLTDEDDQRLDRSRRAMIEELVSNPQWFHVHPNNDDPTNHGDITNVDKKDKEVEGVEREGWYYLSNTAAGKWERYSDEVSKRLEAAWSKCSIAGRRLAASTSETKNNRRPKNKQRDIEGKGRKKKGSIDTKGEARRRVAVDDQRFVDVVKLVQRRFDDERRVRAVKRVGADGSVLIGGGQGIEKQIARGFHSMVNIEETVLVFGGRHKSHKNDVWALDTRSFTWKCLHAGGDIKDAIRPSGRLGHSGVSYGENMWVFGGFDSMGFACNDLWKFDVDQCEWIKIKPVEHSKGKKSKKKKNKNIERERLSPDQVVGRYHHTAVVRKDTMLVFGGIGKDKPVANDVLELNFAEQRWYRVKTKGDGPCGRWGHVGILDDVTGRMVIHGGTQGKGVFLNDTHELDLDTLTWHRVDVSGLEGIRGRAFALSVSSKGNVLMFGGTTLSPDEPPLGELIELRKQRAVDMEDIPAELVMLIFGAATLDAVDLARIGAVCRRWRQLSMDDGLWARPFAVHCRGMDEDEKSKREVVLHTLHCNWRTDKEREEMRLRMLNSTRGKMIKDKEIWRTGNLVNLSHPDIPPTGTTQLKCVVVGDTQVGKTATLITYTTSIFPAVYLPRTYDHFQCTLTCHGTSVCLGLWDTVEGPDYHYDRLRVLSYPQTDVFLILFSLDQPESLQRVASKWVPEIKHVPFVIAGNKADLADYCETKEMVEWGDGLLLAAETGAVRFRTFSALTQRGLRDVFEAVAEAGLCKPTEQDKKNCCVQ